MRGTVRAATLLATLGLFACGGGGGGSSTSIDALPSAVAFQAEQGQIEVASARVTVNFRGDGLLAGYPPEITEPDWLAVSEVSSTASSAQFDLTAFGTADVGQRSTTLRFLTARVTSDGNVVKIKTVDVPVTFTVTESTLSVEAAPAALAFATYATGPLPDAQTVDVAFEGATVTVESAPNWLAVTPPGAQTGSPETYTVQPNTSTDAGSYSGQIVLLVTNADQTVEKRLSFPVGYDVRPHISVGGTPASSELVFGTSDTGAGTVTVSGQGQSWAAQSSAAWLQVDTAQHSGDDAIGFEIDPAGLAIGTHTATVTVTNAAIPAESASWVATLEVVAPTLSVADDIVIGGNDGLDLGPASLNFSVDTGTNAYPWTLELDGAPWLEADQAGGTVANAGDTVLLGADRFSVQGGTYEGTATLSVDVNGQVLTKVVAITFNKEAELLYVASEGIAFASLPSRQLLSRSVTVTSTFDRPDGDWEASSDQAWLSVTPSGTTGGAVTLTADPTGLAANQTHFATVTISSPDFTLENAPQIRVGLYVADSDPAASLKAGHGAGIAMSPVEPLVFVHDESNVITAYNVYTGAAARSFAAGTTDPRGMTLSGDGRTLFVVDRANFQIRELDAVTGALLDTYAHSGNQPYPGTLLYARPNGVPTLFSGVGLMIDLSNDNIFFNGPGARFDEYGDLAVSTDSRSYYVNHNATSALVMTAHTVSRSSLNGGTYTVARTARVEGSGSNVAVGPDGRVYSTGPFGAFVVRDPETLAVTQTLPGGQWSNNSVDVSWDGILVAGSITGSPNIFTYGADGTELGSVQCGMLDVQTQGARVSADGTRLACGSHEGTSDGDGVYLKDVPGL
jgi:hypothetical protein